MQQSAQFKGPSRIPIESLYVETLQLLQREVFYVIGEAGHEPRCPRSGVGEKWQATLYGGPVLVIGISEKACEKFPKKSPVVIAVLREGSWLVFPMVDPIFIVVFYKIDCIIPSIEIR